MNRSERDELGLRLTAYLDGESDAGERAAVETLLRESDEARGLLDDLRTVSEAVAGLERRSPPRDLAGMVRSAAERRELLETPGAGWRVTWRIARVGSAAVVLLACTWASWSLFRLPAAISNADIAPGHDPRIAMQRSVDPSAGPERLERSPIMGEAYSLRGAESEPSADASEGMAGDLAAPSSVAAKAAPERDALPAAIAMGRYGGAAVSEADETIDADDGESSLPEDELAAAARRMLALQIDADEEGVEVFAAEEDVQRLLAAADEPLIELVIRPRDSRERRAVERAVLRWRIEGGQRLSTVTADQEFEAAPGRVGALLRAIAETGAPAGLRSEMDLALFATLIGGGSEVEAETARDEAPDADGDSLLGGLRARFSSVAPTREPAAPAREESAPPENESVEDNLFLRMLRRQAESAGIDVARWSPASVENGDSSRDQAAATVRVRVRIVE